MSVYKKPEFLYFGSSQRYEVLLPDQAYEKGGKKGSVNVVGATSVRDIALAFALGAVPDETGQQDRVMDYQFESGKTTMLYIKGHPNFGGKGYVYKLSPKGFKFTGGTQWVNPAPVKPVEVTEINVDDYLYLCRNATEEEKRQIEENFTER